MEKGRLARLLADAAALQLATEPSLKPKAKHAKVIFERPKRMGIDARSIPFDQKVPGPC